MEHKFVDNSKKGSDCVSIRSLKFRSQRAIIFPLLSFHNNSTIEIAGGLLTFIRTACPVCNRGIVPPRGLFP